MAWYRLPDGPIQAIAAGLINDSPDPDEPDQVMLLIQADTTVVVLDREHSIEFIKSVASLLPYIEEQRAPVDLKSTRLMEDNAKDIAKGVRKNKKRLGLNR